MNKVIFIGGTSYSGSTLLDMILANDSRGYSLGEIVRIFEPYKKHYLKKRHELIEDEKWKNILKNGKNNLYPQLFSHFPDIDLFIDSSKSIFWIKKQTKILEKMGINVKNILIYKSPYELANSFTKRNKIKDFKKQYINYHRQYFTMIDDFKTISYKELTNETDNSIKNLCKYLDIDFFKDKYKYWNKEHYTLFGNNRARVHTNNLSPLGGNQNNLLKEGEKKIYYNPPPENIIKYIDNTKNKLIFKIYNNLKNNISEPRMNPLYITLKYLKDKILKFVLVNKMNLRNKNDRE